MDKMEKKGTNKMITVTLTIDRERHQKLKETSRITRFSMSEITRLALDRLWYDLGDLNNIGPKAVQILFPNPSGLFLGPKTALEKADIDDIDF